MNASDTLGQFNFPPYAVMVENLFKKDLPGHFARLLHSAIGVAGEAGELKTADSRQNILEECGDIEFYWQAAMNDLETKGHPYQDPSISQFFQVTASNWMEVIHISGSSFLDFTKKAWVYGDREPNFVGVHVVLRDIRKALDFAYENLGTSMDEVRYLNQVKLIGKDGRYKSGTYSDAAALAREDKIAEENTHTPRFSESMSIDSTNVGSVNSVLGDMKAVK